MHTLLRAISRACAYVLKAIKKGKLLSFPPTHKTKTRRINKLVSLNHPYHRYGRDPLEPPFSFPQLEQAAPLRSLQS